MYAGSLPPASIYGTWIDNIELVSIDDGVPFDLSGVIEVTLKLHDRKETVDELVLSMTNGDIVIPAPGVIQWRAEVELMGRLVPKLYEVILLLQDATDTVPIVLGTISVED